MDGWVVESGMGQLQVAVAGLGEGGLWQGMRAGPGHLGTRAPGRLGTLASCGAAQARESKPPPLSR